MGALATRDRPPSESRNAVRTLVRDTVSTVVTETIQGFSAGRDQDVLEQQILERIEIVPPSRGCPPGSSPGTVYLTNQQSVVLRAAVALDTVDPGSLADNVAARLEDYVNVPASNPDSLVASLGRAYRESAATESGVRTEPGLPEPGFRLTERTRTDLRESVTERVRALIVQRVQGFQTIRYVRIVTPCIGDLHLSNDSVVTATAGEIAEGVASDIMASSSVQGVLDTVLPLHTNTVESPSRVPEPNPPAATLPRKAVVFAALVVGVAVVSLLWVVFRSGSHRRRAAPE